MKEKRSEVSCVKKVEKSAKVLSKSVRGEEVVDGKKRKLSGDFEMTVLPSSKSDKTLPNKSELCNDRTIYVEGLPFGATDDDLYKFFESCGRIKQMRLARWHDTGRLRGWGI